MKGGVINLGAPAYGMDQAYLRYRKYADKLNTKFVGLGFRIENILRNESCYRNFYFGWDAGGLTKPRFFLRDGRLELLPNPIQKVEDITKLSDLNFVLNNLRSCDRWAPSDEMLRRDYLTFHFPYSRLLWDRRVWKAAQKRCEWRSEFPFSFPQDTWNEPGSKALAAAILKAFVAKVREQRARPLFILLPSRDQFLAHRKGNAIAGHAAFLEICRELSVDCFDSLTRLSPKLPLEDEESFRAYFAPHFHYTGKMNRTLVSELAPWMSDLMQR